MKDEGVNKVDGIFFKESGRHMTRIWKVVRVMKTVFEAEEVNNVSDALIEKPAKIQATIDRGTVVGSQGSRHVYSIATEEVEKIRERNRQYLESQKTEREENERKANERMARAKQLNPVWDVSRVFEGEDQIWKCKMSTTEKGTFNVIFVKTEKKVTIWETPIRDVDGVVLDYELFFCEFGNRISASRSSCESTSVEEALWEVAAHYCWKEA